MSALAIVPVSPTAGECSYCGLRFGTLVQWRGRLRYLQPNREHLIPRAAGGSNARRNIVPSCSICNGVKGGNVFGSFAEARLFVVKALDRGGFTRISDQPLASKLWEPATVKSLAAAVLSRPCRDCGRIFSVNQGQADSHLFCTDRCRAHAARLAAGIPDKPPYKRRQPAPSTTPRRKRRVDGETAFKRWCESPRAKKLFRKLDKRLRAEGLLA